MKKGFKHIAILYLLVAIVFASNGFQVYSSFCNCTKTETISIFAPNDCCTDIANESCISQTVKAKCCSESSIFIKFTEQYVPTFSESLLTIVSTAIFFNYSSSTIEELTKDHSCNIISYTPTIPNLYGKALVYRFHSLKIPCA